MLVVDDSMDAANALAAMLSVLGPQVRTAYDGSSALAVARELQREVVIRLPRQSVTAVNAFWHIR